MTTTAAIGRIFDAVIFDNDGTLVDSSASVERSWVRWAQEHGIDAERLRGFHGVPAAAIIEQIGAHLDPVAALARIEELEVADVTGIVALPGVLEAIRALSQAEPPAPFAIATSATRPLAEVRLAAAGIAVPAGFVTVDDVERGKPHPDPFLLAAERLGVDPAACLACEDAPSGVAAAKAAGCTVLAVTTTAPASELAEADLVVESLADVTFVVESGRVRLQSARP